MWSKTAYTGIDIRDNMIFLASTIVQKGKPELTSLSYIPFDDKEFNEGQILNREALAALLKEHQLRDKSLSKYVHFSIPTKHVILRKIDTLPDIPESSLHKLLDFEIGESIHLPFENPIYDFVKIGRSIGISNENKDAFNLDLNAPVDSEIEPKSEILLIATAHNVSHDISKSMLEASIKPLSAEICATALQRLVQVLHPDWLQDLEMIVDIHDHHVDLHFYHKGIITFSRSIPISKSLYMEHPNDQDNISFAEDEVASESEFSVGATESRLRVYQHNKQIQESLYLTDLMNEVERAQNFYRYSQKQTEQEFSRLILTGNYSESFYKLISARSNFKVERLDYTPIVSAAFSDFELLDCCAVAIGLALRGKYKAPSKRK